MLYGSRTSNSQYNAMRSGLRGAKAGMSLMFVASPISETATPAVTNAPIFQGIYHDGLLRSTGSISTRRI